MTRRRRCGTRRPARKWLDDRNIEPTADWVKEIFSNIERSDNFLFVISPDSVVSTYARKEIDHAARSTISG